MAKKVWRRTGTFSGQKAGQKAIKVWICCGCGLWHERAKPSQCFDKTCGRMDFDYFDSKGEALHWANLLLRQKAGEISDLERQVRMKLMTIGTNGLPVKWAEMVVDFGFIQDGKRRLLDYKPSVGTDYAAQLKIRCLLAMGIKVELVTEKGAV